MLLIAKRVEFDVRRLKFSKLKPNTTVKRVTTFLIRQTAIPERAVDVKYRLVLSQTKYILSLGNGFYCKYIFLLEWDILNLIKNMCTI